MEKTVIGEKKNITWNETFMKMALLVRERSHCVIMPVGAVIALLKKGKETILSMGYNGPPRTVEHCDEFGCTNFEEIDEKLQKIRGGFVGALMQKLMLSLMRLD